MKLDELKTIIRNEAESILSDHELTKIEWQKALQSVSRKERFNIISFAGDDESGRIVLNAMSGYQISVDWKSGRSPDDVLIQIRDRNGAFVTNDKEDIRVELFKEREFTYILVSIISTIRGLRF